MNEVFFQKILNYYKAGRDPLNLSRRMKKAETLLTKLYEKKLLPFSACKWIMRQVNRHLIEPEFKELRKVIAKDLTKFVYNPMYSLPVNGRCVCGSGKKLKKCCLQVFPRAVTGEQFVVIEKMIAKGKRFEVKQDIVIAKEVPHGQEKGQKESEASGQEGPRIVLAKR